MTTYRCRECWDDPRGVPATRVQRLAGIDSWVLCAWCAPATPEKAQRFVDAHRRVRETNAMLRREAQVRGVK